MQLAPNLFKVLRVLIDRPGNAARFLLLGSASPTLLRQSSESLVGRIEVIETAGFTLDEVGVDAMARVWWRGGFPRSFDAAGDAASRIWRREFIRTAVERDLPQLGIGALARRQRKHGAPLPRLAHAGLPGAPVAAVVRQPGQAPGESPEGLCA